MSQDQLRGKLIPKQTLRGRIHRSAGIDDYEKLRNQPQVNGVTLIGNKTTEELGIEVPTKTSDLENDSGFITGDNYYDKTEINEALSSIVSVIPTKVSELDNDSGFITDGDLPTKVSDLENDTGFITSEDVPTKTSDLENDSNYVTIEDVINDTTSSDNQAYSSDKIEAIIDSLLPIDEASGTIATFSTNLAKPLVSLKANVVATQEEGTPTPSDPKAISGWSKVNLYQLGGNLFDKDSENISSGYLINGAGNEVSYTDWSISDFVPVIEGARYYLYGLTTHPNTQQDNFELFDENKTKLGFANVKIYDQPYTIPSGVKYVKFSVKNPDLNTAQFGVSQNPVYCPYDATINTKVINLGNTIYGGVLDVKNNVLRVTHKIKSFSEGNWSYGTWGNRYFFSLNLVDSKNNPSSTLSGSICEIYREQTPSDIYTHDTTGYCMNNTFIRVQDNNYNSLNDWKEAVKNYKYVYLLAEPIEIPLSDIPEIITLIGTNNIFADSGDIEVKYKKSIQKYIDDKIAETQALIL